MPVDPRSVPDFDDLPRVKGMPQGCAWGIFDRAGKKDKLGTLNFLTPEIVRQAAAEVKLGIPVSLNWELNGNKTPFRRPAEHRFIHLNEVHPLLPDDTHYFDDEISFNTQHSSQWDSLCHVTSRHTGLAYNGFSITGDILAQTTSTAANEAPTLDHWHEAGGMAARGVLIDYKAYAEETSTSFHALDGVRITPRHVEACAAHFNVSFQPGDVLLLRTGATEIYQDAGEETHGTKSAALSGLDGCEETARWIWNRRFTAVASDCMGLEAMPGLHEAAERGTLGEMPLHQYLLASFGMPIGELWDLKALSLRCKATRRYSFLLTSVPLNIPCLVASPPNAMAIL